MRARSNAASDCAPGPALPSSSTASASPAQRLTGTSWSWISLHCPANKVHRKIDQNHVFPLPKRTPRFVGFPFPPNAFQRLTKKTKQNKTPFGLPTQPESSIKTTFCWATPHRNTHTGYTLLLRVGLCYMYMA